MDEAGRTSEPPLIMAPPVPNADPVESDEDTVVNNGIMAPSRKRTDSPRSALANRRYGSDSESNGSTGDSSSSASAATESLPVVKGLVTDEPAAGKQDTERQASRKATAEDSARSAPSGSYSRSEWSTTPSPVPEPVGAGVGPAGARSGYAPSGGFTASAAAGAAAAVGGAAAGLKNSVSGAWQKRGSAAPRVQARKPAKRQAMLTLSRVEPWSVMKFSFVASVVAFIILFVAVAVLYIVLSALGVFDSLQHTVTTMTSSQGSAGTNISQWFSASRILGYTAGLGAFNIVLITAMSTIGSVIYNLIAKTVGGIEVTLRETD